MRLKQWHQTLREITKWLISAQVQRYDLVSGFWQHATINQKLETSNQQLETSHQKLATRDQKTETIIIFAS